MLYRTLIAVKYNKLPWLWTELIWVFVNTNHTVGKKSSSVLNNSTHSCHLAWSYTCLSSWIWWSCSCFFINSIRSIGEMQNLAEHFFRWRCRASTNTNQLTQLLKQKTIQYSFHQVQLRVYQTQCNANVASFTFCWQVLSKSAVNQLRTNQSRCTWLHKQVTSFYWITYNSAH